MANHYYVPRWMYNQAQEQGIDTTGLIVLDKLPSVGRFTDKPLATTEGVKRVLMRDGWRPYTNWI
jgi:hypothetical protein